MAAPFIIFPAILTVIYFIEKRKWKAYLLLTFMGIAILGGYVIRFEYRTLVPSFAIYFMYLLNFSMLEDSKFLWRRIIALICQIQFAVIGTSLLFEFFNNK